MAGDSFQEKTESATPKKRSDARQEGQVAKSMEIPSVMVLLAGVAVLYIFSAYFYQNLSSLLQQSLTFERIPEFNLQYGLTLTSTFLVRFILILLPILGSVLLTALVTNFMQVGFFISTKAIAPKFNKLDIVKGFARLFSLRSFVELIKSILKLTIIFLVGYLVVRSQTEQILTLYGYDTAALLVFILKGIFKLFMAVILIMAFLAALDYAYQKWQFEKQIKMTKQEVKEELKQAEGDPQIKSKIRSMQLQAARKRMMQAVPDADVIVTNPTHLAVAIRYDLAAMAAPMVIAKGAGGVAERIKEIAKLHDIAVVENKALARNLYKLVDVGEQVPSQLYRAVAELLAYVYRLKGKTL